MSHDSRKSARSTGRPSGVRRTGVARALSKLGVTSRTLAAQWVRAGRVTINHKPVRDPETPVVLDRDILHVDGMPVGAVEKHYLMLNKPRGLVTTRRDERRRATVYSCFDESDQWLAPVGRLDKASEGLLLFTNDTAWADRLLDPATHLSKIYHVQVDRRLDDARLQQLRDGVRLDDGTLLRVGTVRIIREGEKNSWLEIGLEEGRNRHIRRLLEAMDIKVLRLIRVAIGPVKLGELPKGHSRVLREDELQALAVAANA